jgi:large subunit ribosomal protein L7Ae
VSSRERPVCQLLYKITCVNLEDKNALAKMVEALKTNYNDRYCKVHCNLVGKVLGSLIGMLEKAKAKELSIK